MIPLEKLAIPAVLALISFLALSSQYLFVQLGPHLAHTGSVTAVFNVVLAALLVCYARAIYTDPGRIPREWTIIHSRPPFPQDGEPGNGGARMPLRRCLKCAPGPAGAGVGVGAGGGAGPGAGAGTPKPARAHHCRACGRCIPRMDHHCPWTGNCVSSRTLPHFIRFLFYCVLAMGLMERMLWWRCAEMWENRHWPSYLGPTPFQICHLFVLLATNTVTLFALALMLGQGIWGLLFNTTTIEGWEIERHEAVVKRAKASGGRVYGPNGRRFRVEHQEFPFDIGMWNNAVQGMGTANVLSWFWPFARTPPLEWGLYFPTNGFENPSLSWPPPDPENDYFRVSATGSYRLSSSSCGGGGGCAAADDSCPSTPAATGASTVPLDDQGEPVWLSPRLGPSFDALATDADIKERFYHRQQLDFERRRRLADAAAGHSGGRRGLSDGVDDGDDDGAGAGGGHFRLSPSASDDGHGTVQTGADVGAEKTQLRSRYRGSRPVRPPVAPAPAWRNAEGESLTDFGVDDDDDDGNVPLSELLARDRAK